MSDLLEYLETDFGCKEDLNQIELFFEKACLPMPNSGQFRKITEFGALCLLTDFGCVVRISGKDNQSHPRKIAPLLRVDTSLYSISINPGLNLERFRIETYQDEKDYEGCIEHILNEEGADLVDKHENNIGYLPFPYHDYFVVVDPDFFEIIDRANPEIVSAVNGSDPQSIIYGSLRGVFQIAWKQPTIELIQSEMLKAWEVCKHWKQERRLFSCWDQVFHDFEGTHFEASLYKSNVRQHQNAMALAKA